jgi:hypothetical protein
MTEPGKSADRDQAGLRKVRTPSVRYVRIPENSDASIWMLGTHEAPEPRVVSFHCGSCPDPDNSRLVHINVSTEPWRTRSERARRKARPPVRLLMHVTRGQIEQILSDFGKKDNSDPLRAIFYHKGDLADEAGTKVDGPAKPE